MVSYLDRCNSPCAGWLPCAPPYPLYTAATAKSVQSCPTLCDPMDCSLPGSSVHGISRQEYWSALPLPPPGDLPDPLFECKSPALAGGFFTTVTPGKPQGGAKTPLVENHCLRWILATFHFSNPLQVLGASLAISEEWGGA